MAAAAVSRCTAGAGVAERVPQRGVRSAARCVGGARTALLRKQVAARSYKACNDKLVGNLTPISALSSCVWGARQPVRPGRITCA